MHRILDYTNKNGDYLVEEAEYDDDRTYIYAYNKDGKEIGSFSWLEQGLDFLKEREG